METTVMLIEATDPVVTKMLTQVQHWETTQDRRAIFLTCYALMTQNMLHAIPAGEFQNGAWVKALLERFADYYFYALELYEEEPITAPPVWRLAFDTAQDSKLHVLQHLLVGVNAHINFDLVLTLYDMLEKEWHTLNDAAVQSYYADHCHVNEVIFRTINTVQDQVVERYSPLMDVVDKAFLGLDELFLGQLIRHWREEVWQSAVDLLNSSADTQHVIKGTVAERGRLRGEAILLENGILGLRHLL